LGGPDWLRRRRATGFEAFSSTPLPAESEEVWRYSPIDELALEDFSPELDPRSATASGSPDAVELFESLRTALGRTAASVLVQGGRAVPANWARADGNGNGNGDSEAFEFGPAESVAASVDMLGSVQRDGDALVRLNDAFSPEPIFVDVPGGVTVDGPVLVVHWSEPGTTSFPRKSVV